VSVRANHRNGLARFTVQQNHRILSLKQSVEFCTVALWKNGEIIEEKLFYDLVGLLKQIGVM
jgi:hypothetical protein